MISEYESKFQSRAQEVQVREGYLNQGPGHTTSIKENLQWNLQIAHQERLLATGIEPKPFWAQSLANYHILLTPISNYKLHHANTGTAKFRIWNTTTNK